jgi:hypothetical protein
MAGIETDQTVHLVENIFELHGKSGSIKFTVPTMVEVRCFLERQNVSVRSQEMPDLADGESGEDEEYEPYYGNYDDDDDFGLDGIGFDDEVEIKDMSDEDTWSIAGLFRIGKHAPSWWLNSDKPHGKECTCRPASLLETLQDHASSPDRQSALEAHLGALRDTWDHFWSGDSLINGEGERINGACPNCLVEGREHLGDILDEARNLAEELGEALAAFQSHIDLGIDRY